jgi:hypothetical protein
MGQPPGSLVARGRAVGKKLHVRHEAGSLQPMFGLDQPPAPWRLVRLEARRDARFSLGVVQS